MWQRFKNMLTNTIFLELFNVRRIKYKAKNCSPLKRFMLLFWASLLQDVLLKGKRLVQKGASTVLAFFIFILLSPLLLLSCCVLGCYRKVMKCWILWREGRGIELANLTYRTAMVSNDQDPVLTIVFSLEGVLTKNTLKIWLQDLLEKRNEANQLVHKLFKCQLVELKGFLAWKIDSNFDIDNHLFVAPSHHHGTTLTDRNIQEYMSELCSEHLLKEHSPWQVKLAEGIAENGIQVTWVIFRLHHLLSTQINLPDFSLSLPNPWDSVYSTKLYTLLVAPSASKKILSALNLCLNNCLQHFVCNLYLYFQILQTLCFTLLKFLEVNICYLKDNIKAERKFVANITIRNCSFNMTIVIKNIKLLLSKIFKTFYNFLIIFYSKVNCIFAYLFTKLIILLNITKLIMNGKNSEFNMLVEAAIELYWMMRALLSLPRLLMEELFKTRKTAPLNIWKRKRLQKWKRTIVAWNEEIPLEGAKGIQGVSGASLSCVLITALSGAIRDLLRFSGAHSPENIHCTLPVCIPHTSTNKGLLPISLPTGCTNGQQALREVSKAIDRMKKYPETYLASAWLIKNLSKFLPQMVFRRLMKCLSRSHPVLLINLVGSSTPSSIWGLKLRSAFYWRPPQNDAVLSVCISSYCGLISMGVMADGWAIPHAHFLPQSFVSHLNELAVETGVNLRQRKQSPPWSRSNSPRLSSSPSPSSTPTFNSIYGSYNTCAVAMNYRTKLRWSRRTQDHPVQEISI